MEKKENKNLVKHLPGVRCIVWILLFFVPLVELIHLYCYDTTINCLDTDKRGMTSGDDYDHSKEIPEKRAAVEETKVEKETQDSTDTTKHHQPSEINHRL